jgi:sec-independent protein translocase protein TatC
MRAAPRMFFLKKVFQLRDHANPDSEKPFLEHLEDLRDTIVRMVITLAVSVAACFVLQDDLMTILRHPVEQVRRLHESKKIPAKDALALPLSVEVWEKAKTVEHAAAGLDPAAREVFYQSLHDDTLRFHAESAALLRGAQALPATSRDAYLAALPVSPEMKRQVTALLKSGPSTETEARGNLQFMSALKPTETFMLSMKLSFFAGVILSFPLLLYFLLQFILPGLHDNEKRVLWPSLTIGFGLFLGGVLFAYFLILPRALGFFFEWGDSLGVRNDWRIGEYISFAIQFTLLFGLSFELPVVVMVLVKLGLLGYQTMKRTRSYAIVAIFIIAAILTPTPDILTQCLMAGPMILLYEACIWLAWWDEKKQRKQEEAEAAERTARLMNEHDAYDQYGTEEGEDEGEPADDAPKPPQG